VDHQDHVDREEAPAFEAAFRVAALAIPGVEVADHLCGWMEEVLVVVVVAFEARGYLHDVHD
jgi:hypothetical protein